MRQGGIAAIPEFPSQAPAARCGHDECIALVAHELRNPLGPLRNVAEILTRSTPDAAALQWAAAIIDRQVSAMTLLIDDLLDASSLRAGKIQLRRTPAPISRVLERALETAHPVVLERGHTLRIRMPPEPVVLEADVRRLCQVLHNLIVNAAKYTSPGGRICVDVQRDEGDAVVTVSDTGIGIEPAELDTVFELFTQAEHTTTEHAGGGIGVGLYLARSLIEAHGGTLRAVSNGAGRGSAFVIRLPCNPAVTPHTAEEAGYVRNRTDESMTVG